MNTIRNKDGKQKTRYNDRGLSAPGASSHGWPLTADASLALVTMVNAIASGIMRPGTYSLDARLFAPALMALPAKDRDA